MTSLPTLLRSYLPAWFAGVRALCAVVRATPGGVTGVVLATALAAAPASAATVAALYEATVPGDASDAGRDAAASEALKQVVVRATGRRGAAADPALASLYADARRYAQTFRAGAGGQVTVGFDGAALEAVLAQAGQPLWGRERPLTLVLYVLEKPNQPRVLVGSADSEERRAIERTAALRGLPLVWPGAIDAATTQQRIDDVLAGRGEALREFARRYGAEVVLWGRGTPAAVNWNWLGAAGNGAQGGTLTDGVQTLADRVAAAYSASQAASVGLLGVLVRGITDLRDYAATIAMLESLANVRGVALDEMAGDTARFRINYRGDVDSLRRSAAAAGRLVPDDSVTGDGLVRFVLQP